MIQSMKKFQAQLTLMSVALAIGLGIAFPEIFESIQFVGDLFIKLLKAFALPLICSALIVALGDMGGQLKNLKNLARNTVSYMFVSEIAAVTIALILFNVFKPGVGLSPDLILRGEPLPTVHDEQLSFANFILSIFPQNIFESLSKFELLPAVVFSIMFGIGCNIVGEKGQSVRHFATSVREIATACLHGVMVFAPIGIFALLGSGIAQAHLKGDLKSDAFALVRFVLVLLLGLFLHGLWQLLVVTAVSRQSVFKVLKKSIPLFSTAFATSSSVATLPVAMQAADDLKASPTTTRFMLPLCASINVGGMMMYEVAAALFFSQVLGFDLSMQQQLSVALICILAGMAEGGIPETSLVSLVVVFKMVNVPSSAISILLPLDRIIDRIRTMVNIFGNVCGAVTVSKFTEKQIAEIGSSDIPVSEGFVGPAATSEGAS